MLARLTARHFLVDRWKGGPFGGCWHKWVLPADLPLRAKPSVCFFASAAQEKASVWRSWPAKDQEKRPHPHMGWGRQMAFVNHFYFYIWDPEWGPAFIKTNAYAPWPIWVYLNGHEWAKRQCAKGGVA